jgi:hypothetical protein
MNSTVFVGRNNQGYFTATGNISCVLLATLNLLQEHYQVKNSELSDITERFWNLFSNDREATFLSPATIPFTIEHITDGAFFGIVIAPTAKKDIRGLGIPERYALDSDYIDKSMLPLIYVHNQGETEICHALVALRFDPLKGFFVIDDGEPMNLKTLPTPGIAYKVEKQK